MLLAADGPERLPDAVAPGLDTLGFMLPNTPLHLLMLRRIDRPVVMTSGNLSDEPQVIDDDERSRRGSPALRLCPRCTIATSPTASTIRWCASMAGRAAPAAPRPRLCAGADPAAAGLRARAGPAGLRRRAEGHLLPASRTAPRSCRSTWAISRSRAPSTTTQSNLAALRGAVRASRRSCWSPTGIPEYLSSKLARRSAATRAACRSIEVQHHHAHVAACLAENGVGARCAAGARHRARRSRLRRRRHDLGRRVPARRLPHATSALGTFKPVAMPGGAQAVREPWRNPYAHLMAEIGWAALRA